MRDIAAVFFFVAAVGLLVAQVTFHSEDALANGQVRNLVGPMGHRLASNLFGAVGICAYLIPIALFYVTVALFVRGRSSRRGRQIAGLLTLALSGAVLAHLLIGQSTLGYPPGGAVGAALGEGLRGALSTFGSVLVMSAVAAGALIVATDSGFARLCVAIAARIAQVSVAAWSFAVAQSKEQYAAWQERRAQRAIEREEEEAAFAQALAEAEEAERAQMEEQLAELPELAESLEFAEAPPLIVSPHDEDETDADERRQSAEELSASEAELVADEVARLARVAEARLARDEAEQRARDAAARAARRARTARLTDPAWTMNAAPDRAGTDSGDVATGGEAAVGPVEPTPATEEKPSRPILALPSSPPAAANAPPVVAPVPPAAAPAPVPAAAAPAPSEAAKPAIAVPADVRPEPVVAVGPVLPLIVEPKVPPRPSRGVPEKKDPFAFEGASDFSLPPISMLEVPEDGKQRVLDKEAFFATAEKLREKLVSFGIQGTVKEIRPGPVVTMYEFEPGPGVKISKIAALADDLAMAMEALKVRIVAPIPGKGVVGIEVPNRERESVYLREIVEQDAFLKSSSKLALAIGKNVEGQPYITDLAKMPHLLIAGTTGSGKSVSVNAMIMSILFKATPEEVRMIMVDPKVTELSIYEGIPHLLLPVVTDPRKAALALRWGVEEMERRYQLLAEAGVRNIAGYNKFVERLQDEEPAAEAQPAKSAAEGGELRIIDIGEGEAAEGSSGEATLGVTLPEDDDASPAVKLAAEQAAAQAAAAELSNEVAVKAALEAATSGPKKEKPRKLPYIVIVIDEVADLMMVASREVEMYVARLAQMARAAGIHLMIATQRPSTDVITGVIKANFPTRMSFQLRSKPDSMTILGTVGAEALLGMGDMLILPPTSAHLERVHGAYVSDGEIQEVVAHLRSQGKPVYDESILRPRDEEGDGEGGGGTEEYQDEMYDQCLAIVSEMRQVSVSMLQRKLRLGYNRAARIIERMESEGVVGPANGSKPREVLIRQVGEMHHEINV